MTHQAPLLMGILQARIQEWVAVPSSRGSSQPGIQPISLISPVLAGGFFTTEPLVKFLNIDDAHILGLPKSSFCFLIPFTVSKLFWAIHWSTSTRYIYLCWFTLKWLFSCTRAHERVTKNSWSPCLIIPNFKEQSLLHLLSAAVAYVPISNCTDPSKYWRHERPFSKVPAPAFRGGFQSI